MTAPLTDSLGNPVTLRDESSLAAINDFVEGFIACEARAVNVLQAQADASPLVQAYCAALHMFAESADAPRNARPFIEQALAHAHQASEREQRWVAAVAAWVDGDLPRAIALHEEQARLHPRDLASLKLGQYHCFNRGDSPAMLRLALQAQHAAADVPYLTACWPLAGSNATGSKKPKLPPATPSTGAAKSPGPTTHWPTSC